MWLFSLGVAAITAIIGPAFVQSTPPVFEVVEVHGVIDPALAGHVRRELDSAGRAGSAVILQVDSRGAYGREAIELGRAVRSAKVPVVAWVGPSGARAAGGALFLVYSASLVAIAPGAGIGPARPFDLGTDVSREDPGEVSAFGDALVDLAEGAGARPEGVRRLLTQPALAAGPAVDSGAAEVAAADVTQLIRALDGLSVRAGERASILETLDGEGRVTARIRFHDIGLIRRLLHAVSTPTAVYVLIVLALWAIAFELTQPGVGVAGISGVLALGLAGYGLTVVPVRWAGLSLLLLGVALQGLDVVVRRVGVLTVAGTLAFAAGSVLAWRGVAPAIDLSPWLIALFTLAGALFFGFGLTVALRARERVRSAQIGLVGLVGEARKDLDPEGAVFVKGTLWRARSSDGPIPKGSRVRVRGIDGLVLRVEEEPE